MMTFDQYLDGILAHVLDPRTVAAIFDVAEQSRGVEVVDIGLIYRTARRHRCRVNPVAAAYGWLRQDPRRSRWAHVVAHPAATLTLPADLEVVAAFGLYRSLARPTIRGSVYFPRRDTLRPRTEVAG